MFRTVFVLFLNMVFFNIVYWNRSYTCTLFTEKVVFLEFNPSVKTVKMINW